ncbi:MAG: DNA internalization-related competence protein ComEC/Rec2, partial [Rhodothermales bacterium]|nr:DNA internalization-related competence protein ComEC/Rec2 [Rhodothermales bacterium]
MVAHVRASTYGPTRPIAAALLLVFCGITSYSRDVLLGDDSWKEAIESERVLELVGTLKQVAAGASGSRLELHRIVRLPDHTVLPGRIHAYVDSAAGLDLASGTVVCVLGRIRGLPQKRNPSDFDYGLYLRRRGFKAVMVVDGPPVALGKPRAKGRLLTAARRHIRRGLAKGVQDPRVRSILSALLIGDRTEIDPTVRRQFVESGLIHLLAVSGLHVMVVGYLFYNISGQLLRRVGMRWGVVEAVRVVSTAGVLLSYMEITGRPDSVVRAVVMACFLISSPLLRRNSSSMNSLCVAATLILVGSPSSLFEAGFQLSVAAVSAILTMHPLLVSTPIMNKVSAIIGKSATSSLSVTIAATLGVSPVLLWHFGEMSIAGLLLNLPAVPLTAGALIAGVIGSTLVTLPGPVASVGGLYWRASEVATHLVVETAAFGSSNLPLVYRTSPDIFLLSAIAMTVCAASTPRRQIRWLILIGVLMSLAAARWHDAGRHALKRTEIVFFDVGHGDAALLTTSAGKAMLVDAGDRPRRSRIAVRAIKNHLRKTNVRSLDLLILSHAHSDHIGGMESLLGEVDVRRVVYSGTPSKSRSLQTIRRRADSMNVQIVEASRGDTLRLDATVTVQVLWPDRKRLGVLNENNRSLVLRVVTESGAILLTGDAEREAEWEIVRTFSEILAADIVKVPHHGSSTSSTTSFALASARAGKQHAIVSVAAKNSYGLPDGDVIDRWQSNGFHVHRTDADHAVWFVADG